MCDISGNTMDLCVSYLEHYGSVCDISGNTERNEGMNSICGKCLYGDDMATCCSQLDLLPASSTAKDQYEHSIKGIENLYF